MKLLHMLMLLVGFSCSSVSAQAPVVTLTNVGPVCESTCQGRHAIIFVHGIYGSKETFTNNSVLPSFDWPSALPKLISGVPLDAYVIEYKTLLFSWATQNIASLDMVVENFHPIVRAIRERGYKSVNFVAHSLGGNIVTAYLHSVKSEEGHNARAQHGFLLTLGTPVSGAAIANVGSMLKDLIGAPDPLLESLKRDNTFLRMMNVWSRQEDAKGGRFQCRPVSFYAGIETKGVGPVQIVETNSAMSSMRMITQRREFSLNHIEISKPKSELDPLFRWLVTILNEEIHRLELWHAPQSGLCHRLIEQER
jgi:hypothetical protein